MPAVRIKGSELFETPIARITTCFPGNKYNKIRVTRATDVFQAEK